MAFISLIVLAIYFLFLAISLLVTKRNKEETNQNNSVLSGTFKPQKAVKTIVIKAVKNKIDNLPNITKHYIFDGETPLPEKQEEEKLEDIPQIEIEMTINDESVITELENNDTLDDLEKMASLMRQMASGEPKEKDNEQEKINNKSYTEYQDIDDNLIAEFLNTDFLTNIEENK